MVLIIFYKLHPNCFVYKKTNDTCIRSAIYFACLFKIMLLDDINSI